MLRRSIKDIVLWMIGRRRRFIIQGASMLPTLHDGDWVLVEECYYKKHSPEEGELVLIEHPQRQGYLMVKRIFSITEEALHIVGDNPEYSTDSRHFGLVHLEKLRARVWSRL